MQDAAFGNYRAFAERYGIDPELAIAEMPMLPINRAEQLPPRVKARFAAFSQAV